MGRRRSESSEILPDPKLTIVSEIYEIINLSSPPNRDCSVAPGLRPAYAAACA